MDWGGRGGKENRAGASLLALQAAVATRSPWRRPANNESRRARKQRTLATKARVRPQTKFTPERCTLSRGNASDRPSWRSSAAGRLNAARRFATASRFAADAIKQPMASGRSATSLLGTAATGRLDSTLRLDTTSRFATATMQPTMQAMATFAIAACLFHTATAGYLHAALGFAATAMPMQPQPATTRLNSTTLRLHFAPATAGIQDTVQ